MSEPARRDKPARVFLDSNVIFSGLHSPHGPPGAILEKAATGDIVAVVSRQVLDEVVRTIKKKLPDALPPLREFLRSSAFEVVADRSPADTRRWEGILEAGDAAILAAAEAAEPDYFVTGDSHFLRNRRLQSLRALEILAPLEFVEAMAGHKPI